MKTDRRNFLKATVSGLAGLASVPVLGASVSRLSRQSLAGNISLITGAPGNVIAL
jgi:hypothetical protein